MSKDFLRRRSCLKQDAIKFIVQIRAIQIGWLNKLDVILFSNIMEVGVAAIDHEISPAHDLSLLGTGKQFKRLRSYVPALFILVIIVSC